MKKTFDKPHEGTEAPCLCDCGKWFDLDEGYHSERYHGQVICAKCHKEEQAEVERLEERANK